MNRLTTGFLALFGVVTLASTAMVEPQGLRLEGSQTADWRKCRGPGGLGRSDAQGLPVTWSADKNAVWKTELPGPGASSPIVLGERVFVTCYSGYGVPGGPAGDISKLKRHLLCLNRSDAKIRWAKEIAAKLPEERYEGHMLQHGYASSTPVGDGERVLRLLRQVRRICL